MENKITTILWDVDGTLLDFLAAEKAAIRSLFQEYQLGECSDEQIRRYSVINRSYWERLERGEISKPEVLVGRFRSFFEKEGIDPSIAPEFNEKYQLRLGDTIVFRDDSLNIVRSLQGKVRQYVVSNGTVKAQTKKLDRSGLGVLMDGVFLSEQLGVEKPNVGFFDQVFEAIGPVDKKQVMIVGDSLTSDIAGGERAGIVTCWYNPGGHQDRTIAALIMRYKIFMRSMPFFLAFRVNTKQLFRRNQTCIQHPKKDMRPCSTIAAAKRTPSGSIFRTVAQFRFQR